MSAQPRTSRDQAISNAWQMLPEEQILDQFLLELILRQQAERFGHNLVMFNMIVDSANWVEEINNAKMMG